MCVFKRKKKEKNSEQADSNHRPKDNFIFINLLQSSALPSELCSVYTFFFFLFIFNFISY